MLAEAVLKKNDKQKIQMHCTRRHGAIMATACVVTSSALCDLGFQNVLLGLRAGCREGSRLRVFQKMHARISRFWNDKKD